MEEVCIGCSNVHTGCWSDQEQRNEEIKLSYDLYLKAFFITKIATYFMLIVWCWRSPVASVPQNLVQPFGRFLSWKAGDSLNDKIMIGIRPLVFICILR
ncbi:hypothetical protein SLE2022_329860 [Rubroshorea leprosula]